MPITARVKSDQRMAARHVLATCDVSAERCRAAALDRTHHLQLIEAHMAAVGLAPSGTVVAEDVRDHQSWSNQNGAIAPAAPQCLALRACGAARSGARAGSRSWRLFRSPRGCSEPSSRACRVQATPESPECLCRPRADGLRRNGEANEERAFCAAPPLSPPP